MTGISNVMSFAQLPLMWMRIASPNLLGSFEDLILSVLAAGTCCCFIKWELLSWFSSLEEWDKCQIRSVDKFLVLYLEYSSHECFTLPPFSLRGSLSAMFILIWNPSRTSSGSTTVTATSWPTMRSHGCLHRSSSWVTLGFWWNASSTTSPQMSWTKKKAMLD